jgi:hypothetical protein
MLMKFLHANGLTRYRAIFHKKRVTYTKTYFKGVDFHYAVLTNAEQILIMIRTCARVVQLNDLEHLDDSV